MRARDEIILRSDPASMDVYRPSQPVMPPMPAELPEQSLVRGILRHFWIVVLFAIVGAGGAWFYLKHAMPFYSSSSTINIEPSGPRFANDMLSSVQRSNYLYTQAELIKSTPILSIVAEKPEVKALKTFEIMQTPPLLYLRETVESDVGRKDDLITISVISPIAEDAAVMANAVVDAFEEYQSVEKKTNSSSLLETFRGSKEKAEKELAEIQAALVEFQRQNPSLMIGGVIQKEMDTLSAALTQAKLETIEAKATYAPGHPVVRKAQLKEESIAADNSKKLGEWMNLNRASAEFVQKSSEMAEKKELIRRLQTKIDDLELSKSAEQIFNTISVLEPARPADYPSHPRRNRTMAAAILAGALLGCGLALLRDRLDGRMRSVEEIQTVVGLPILGVVPAMSGRRTAVARAMTVHLDPRSVVAEAYRTIRTAVYFGINGARCKTLLVTSPEPGDGKTTSASNLAIAIAQTGRSVLLLDADFRKPTQHKNLDIKDAVGLSSVLAGRETLERAIQRTGVEGLDILPCGPIPGNPSEILNSQEFAELVDTLVQRYDHIVFDSPPVNPVTDARILGAVCDATILVLRADKSTRKSGEHARNALLGVGARVLGAIVNDAPHKKGYDVYGGSYYGSGEVAVRPRGRDSDDVARPRLPRAVSEVTDS